MTESLKNILSLRLFSKGPKMRKASIDNVLRWRIERSNNGLETMKERTMLVMANKFPDREVNASVEIVRRDIKVLASVGRKGMLPQ
ncbi:hypothetical protein TrispH2_010996 [Trichoplax sp. H2]|nr:hypothetical protein TrispH2_010996 [Trichoplax sp. H2]|eukprot:RDD37600.1 hypothetical protein TrispH2_010996 [Trichoplax sp. H2]